MLVKITKKYKIHQVGTIIDVDDDQLIKEGYATPYDDKFTFPDDLDKIAPNIDNEIKE